MSYALLRLLSTLALMCLCDVGAARDAKGPISEKTYKEAAHHCHSDRVIRLQGGIQNEVAVDGMMSPSDREPREVRIVECVRRYLGIPKKDVVVLAN